MSNTYQREKGKNKEKGNFKCNKCFTCPYALISYSGYYSNEIICKADYKGKQHMGCK